ncbi:LysE family translocator [Stackebrandtia soli]|uniref:LysE family translocator n=1 Tax=Stackebrandtia soli TaxID=1892856 RepID=UPI0039E9DDEB
MSWQLVVGLTVALIPIVLAPGTSAILVAQHAATGGWRDIASVMLGTSVGLYLHASFAALGLSALVMASATALTVVKVVGAAYLVGLGVHLLVTGAKAPSTDRTDGTPGRALAQAFVGNIVNPKAALVYLTLPVQFLRPGDSVTVAAFTLATIHIVMLLPWLSLWAFVVRSTKRSQRLRSTTTVIRRTGGLLLIGLGVRSAFTG